MTSISLVILKSLCCAHRYCSRLPVSQKLALAGLQPVLHWVQFLVLRRQRVLWTLGLSAQWCALLTPPGLLREPRVMLWMQQAGCPPDQHGLLLASGQELLGLGGAARLALRQHCLQGNILPLHLRHLPWVKLLLGGTPGRWFHTHT